MVIMVVLTSVSLVVRMGPSICPTLFQDVVTSSSSSGFLAMIHAHDEDLRAPFVHSVDDSVRDVRERMVGLSEDCGFGNEVT